jgi:PadR family transcriptional regulator, regulatory protein PadR
MVVARSSVMLRGVLDLCLLALLEGDELYGYEIASRLRERQLEVGDGSIYPLLARLERSGDVRAVRRPSVDGPDRRYWTLTAAGRSTLRDGRADWSGMSAAVDAILTSTGDKAGATK